MLSQPQYSTQLISDGEILLRAYGNSKLSILSNFCGEKAEVMFEEVTYSSLAYINKEELQQEWQFIKRAVFQEKKAMMAKNTSPPLLKEIKDTMETSYASIFP